MDDTGRTARDVAVEMGLEQPSSGPRRVTSLASRRSPLAAPAAQRRRLATLELSRHGRRAEFAADLAACGHDPLRPTELDVLQVNLGKLCNMTCAHCHVDAGPDRVAENMDRATVDACLDLLDRTAASTVDITGGAPELNPHFRHLVDACARRGKHVIDRCNLTVLLLPQLRDLPGWLGERGVEIACSLPHVRRLNTDSQRGDGTHEKSLRALRVLNEAGYGQGDPARRLTLVANPAGAFLAGAQGPMEREWRGLLESRHGVRFDRLIALNNMPIARYLEWLDQTDNLQAYMERLLAAFNPATVDGLMCRNTLSISWDGRVFDCDFNQMLDMESEVRRPDVRALSVEELSRRAIRTDRHCYGCTAGAGSSCGGALSD